MRQLNKLNLTILTLVLLGTFLLGLTVSHAEGSQLKPILKVAVIDSGYTLLPFDNSGFKLCKEGHYDYSKNEDKVGSDDLAHGSFVLSLINQHANTQNICFIVYKVFGPGTSIDSIDSALIKAYRNGAKVINMSLTMFYHSKRTENIIKFLTKRGIKIFAAAGNANQNFNTKCNRYPACFNIKNENLVVVGALDEDADVAKYSNYGARIALFKYGRTALGARGTSFAAPRAAGDYIRSLKYDEPTK